MVSFFFFFVSRQFTLRFPQEHSKAEAVVTLLVSSKYKYPTPSVLFYFYNRQKLLFLFWMSRDSQVMNLEEGLWYLIKSSLSYQGVSPCSFPRKIVPRYRWYVKKFPHVQTRNAPSSGYGFIVPTILFSLSRAYYSPLENPGR